MTEKKYLISEIFRSFQGEGLYTGMPAIFVRFFGCNLACNFGGVTDTQDIESLDDFVVPSRGCDSGYAWMDEMRHLAIPMTADEIVRAVVDLLPTRNGDIAIVYTGGEPMLNQEAISTVYSMLATRLSLWTAIHIIETNGTISPSPSLQNLDIHYSISPKLTHIARQQNSIRYSHIEDIIKASTSRNQSASGHYNFILKFVLDNTDDAWAELDAVLDELERRAPIPQSSIHNFVFIMPIGADFDQQTSPETEAIVLRAIERGYKITLRTHIYVFKNKPRS